jgi:hypothetical protein
MSQFIFQGVKKKNVKVVRFISFVYLYQDLRNNGLVGIVCCVLSSLHKAASSLSA